MDTIDLTVPKSWDELTQEQLRSIYVLMARYGSAKEAAFNVAAAFIIRWCGLKVISPYGRNWLISKDGKEFVMDAQEFTSACLAMSWLKEFPAEPVRLLNIDGKTAMSEDPTYDLTLEQWLACDNLYQGYQYTEDTELLTQMAAILYSKDDIELTSAESISIFYWWASVKQKVSAMFPHFFQPAPVNSGEAPDADTMRRSVDAQIRALTKGDITKEEYVLNTQAIRALTELDAQAKEYQDLNKKYPSSTMHNA